MVGRSLTVHSAVDRGLVATLGGKRCRGKGLSAHSHKVDGPWLFTSPAVPFQLTSSVQLPIVSNVSPTANYLILTKVSFMWLIGSDFFESITVKPNVKVEKNVDG